MWRHLVAKFCTNAIISNKFMWRHLLTKFASYRVLPVMVSTHGSVVPLAMFFICLYCSILNTVFRIFCLCSPSTPTLRPPHPGNPRRLIFFQLGGCRTNHWGHLPHPHPPLYPPFTHAGDDEKSITNKDDTEEGDGDDDDAVRQSSSLPHWGWLWASAPRLSRFPLVLRSAQSNTLQHTSPLWKHEKQRNTAVCTVAWHCPFSSIFTFCISAFHISVFHISVFHISVFHIFVFRISSFFFGVLISLLCPSTRCDDAALLWQWPFPSIKSAPLPTHAQVFLYFIFLCFVFLYFYMCVLYLWQWPFPSIKSAPLPTHAQVFLYFIFLCFVFLYFYMCVLYLWQWPFPSIKSAPPPTQSDR